MSSAEHKALETLSGPELDRMVAEACGIQWLSGADYGHYLGTVRRVDSAADPVRFGKEVGL